MIYSDQMLWNRDGSGRFLCRPLKGGFSPLCCTSFYSLSWPYVLYYSLSNPPTPSCFPSIVFLPFLSPLITPSLPFPLLLCAFITYPPQWQRNGVIFLCMWWGSGLFWGSRVAQGRQRGRKLEGRGLSPPHALTMRTEQRRGSSQARAGERERPQASSTHLETHTHTHTHTSSTHLF